MENTIKSYFRKYMKSKPSKSGYRESKTILLDDLHPHLVYMKDNKLLYSFWIELKRFIMNEIDSNDISHFLQLAHEALLDSKADAVGYSLFADGDVWLNTERFVFGVSFSNAFFDNGHTTRSQKVILTKLDYYKELYHDYAVKTILLEGFIETISAFLTTIPCEKTSLIDVRLSLMQNKDINIIINYLE